MSKQKYAAGPWRLHPTDDTTVVAADGSEVAAIDGDYNDPDLWPMMEANARLIAAAPELAEALRVFAGPPEEGEHMTDVPNDSPVTIRCQLGDVRRARALLARIEGGV